MVNKGVSHCLFRRAAVLQPAGVVIIFRYADLIGKGQGHVDFAFVLWFVRPVPHLFFRLPALHRGQGVLPRQLLHMVGDPVLIIKNRLLKAPACLVAEHEFDSRVDNSLAFDHIQKISYRHVNIGENLKVRLPFDFRAGVLFCVRLLVESAHVFPMLEMERVPEPIPADIHIHIFRCVLGRAQAQAVQAQGILVAFRGSVVIFAAGVQLAEHQLPVVPVLVFIVVHRNTSPVILHLNGAVLKPGQHDLPPKALSRLVNRIGEDLKNRVLASLNAVGAENDRRTFPDPVRAF